MLDWPVQRARQGMKDECCGGESRKVEKRVLSIFTEFERVKTLEVPGRARERAKDGIIITSERERDQENKQEMRRGSQGSVALALTLAPLLYLCCACFCACRAPAQSRQRWICCWRRPAATLASLGPFTCWKKEYYGLLEVVVSRERAGGGEDWEMRISPSSSVAWWSICISDLLFMPASHQLPQRRHHSPLCAPLPAGQNPPTTCTPLWIGQRGHASGAGARSRCEIWTGRPSRLARASAGENRRRASAIDTATTSAL